MLADELVASPRNRPLSARKPREPQIVWQPTSRTGDQLGEYLAKAGYVAREITAGRFYKRPGMWCSWCDYLPVCLGDKRKVEDTLVTVE